MDKFKKIVEKTKPALILFLLYVIILALVQLKDYVWWHIFYVHIFFAFLFGALLGRQFFLFIYVQISNYELKTYLTKFRQHRDIPAETVIILGHADWSKLQAWIKPNVFQKEIKQIVHLLEKKKRDFSFFPNATVEDVEKIMKDKNIREVYFIGHGTSHTFELVTDDILCYCDFNEPNYTKEYAHQVHCGTPHGKSLVDYVVPEENKAKCFLFRRKIDGNDIERELKKRIEDAELPPVAHVQKQS
jgi:hypothetical protein